VRLQKIQLGDFIKFELKRAFQEVDNEVILSFSLTNLLCAARLDCRITSTLLHLTSII